MVRIRITFCLALLFFYGLIAYPGESADIEARRHSSTIFEAIDRLEKTGKIPWDQALLYRLYAYRERNLLPQELSSLPYPEHIPCPAYLFFQARKDMGLCSKEMKPLIAAMLARPDSIGHVQSLLYPLRVHYETVEQIPVAGEFLGYAEMSWQYFEEAGFYPPPPDFGKGGSDDFDLYLKASAVGGAIVLEDYYPDTWWMDMTSYTIAEPNPDRPMVISTIAHELNHAFQAAMNVSGNNWCFYEATSTIMEDRVFPEIDWINSTLTPYFQTRPFKPIDWWEGPGKPYQYAAFMFPQFLLEYYDNNQVAMMAQIWEGMLQDTSQGEPDYLDVIADILPQYGPETFDEMFQIFTTWRYFTDSNDDGEHFTEGDEYYRVEIEAEYKTGEFPFHGTSSENPPAEYGSNFIHFSGPEEPDPLRGDCTIYFNGDPGKIWSVEFIIFPRGSNSPLYEYMDVGQDGFGTHSIAGWENKEKAIMVVLNQGDGDHDPDFLDWDVFDYRYSASYGNAPVPNILASPGPGTDNPARVRGFHLDGSPNSYTDFLSDPNDMYGLNLDSGDMDGDGMDEVMTGGGPGREVSPKARLFEADGAPFIGVDFNAYNTDGHGVDVALGDIDRSGRCEVITGPASHYGPHVRAFRYVAGGSIEAIPEVSFLAYGTKRWGVRVAAGDLNNNSAEEILTGPGPGPVYGPHVRAFRFDGDSVTPVAGVSFLAYGTPRWGVNLACGDVDGDGREEIITGAGPGPSYGPHIRAFNFDGSMVAADPAVSFMAYRTRRWGVNVACSDIDGDGMDEIITGPGPSSHFGAHVRCWNYDGIVLEQIPGASFFAFQPDVMRYGVLVAGGLFLE